MVPRSVSVSSGFIFLNWPAREPLVRSPSPSARLRGGRRPPTRRVAMKNCLVFENAHRRQPAFVPAACFGWLALGIIAPRHTVTRRQHGSQRHAGSGVGSNRPVLRDQGLVAAGRHLQRRRPASTNPDAYHQGREGNIRGSADCAKRRRLQLFLHFQIEPATSEVLHIDHQGDGQGRRRISRHLERCIPPEQGRQRRDNANTALTGIYEAGLNGFASNSPG